MSLVTSSSRPPGGGAFWPNRQTYTTSTIVAMNLACYLLKTPFMATVVLNFPLRGMSMYQTAAFKRYYKFPMDVAAFIILPLPHGILFSIGLDAASEILNYYHKPTTSQGVFSTKRLDPTNFENACKILNLRPEEATDLVKVKAQHEVIMKGLEERKRGLSEPLAEGLQQLIEDAQTAYTTLCPMRAL